MWLALYSNMDGYRHLGSPLPDLTLSCLQRVNVLVHALVSESGRVFEAYKFNYVIINYIMLLWPDLLNLSINYIYMNNIFVTATTSTYS